MMLKICESQRNVDEFLIQEQENWVFVKNPDSFAHQQVKRVIPTSPCSWEKQDKARNTKDG